MLLEKTWKTFKDLAGHAKNTEANTKGLSLAKEDNLRKKKWLQLSETLINETQECINILLKIDREKAKKKKKELIEPHCM